MSNLLTKNSSFRMPLNSRFPSIERATNSYPNADEVRVLLPPTRRSINTLTSRSLSPTKFSRHNSCERRATSAKVKRDNSSIIPARKPSNSSSRNNSKTNENIVIGPTRSLNRASSSQQKSQIPIKKRDSDSLQKSQTEDSPDKHTKNKVRADVTEQFKANKNRSRSSSNTNTNSSKKIEIKEVHVKNKDRSTSPVKWQSEYQPYSSKRDPLKNMEEQQANTNIKTLCASPTNWRPEKDNANKTRRSPSSKKEPLKQTEEQEANINNKGQRQQDNVNRRERSSSPIKRLTEVGEKNINVYKCSSLLKWLVQDLESSKSNKTNLENRERIKNSNRVQSPIECTIEDLTDKCRSLKKNRLSLKCQLEEKLKLLKDRIDGKCTDRSTSPVNWYERQSKKRCRSTTPKKSLNEERDTHNFHQPRGLSSSKITYSNHKTTQNEVERRVKKTISPQEERECISWRNRSTSLSPKKSQAEKASHKKAEPEKRTKIVYAEEYLKNKRNFTFSAPFRRTQGCQSDRPNRNKSVETTLGIGSMACNNLQPYGIHGPNSSSCNVYKFVVQLV